MLCLRHCGCQNDNGTRKTTLPSPFSLLVYVYVHVHTGCECSKDKTSSFSIFEKWVNAFVFTFPCLLFIQERIVIVKMKRLLSYFIYEKVIVLENVSYFRKIGKILWKRKIGGEVISRAISFPPTIATYFPHPVFHCRKTILATRASVPSRVYCATSAPT